MKALASIIALVIAAGSARADAPRPDDAKCRGYVEQGLAQKDPVKARVLLHTARVRCANPVALVMIARTYQDAGDLPHTLAYLEAFLAVAEPGHQARPAVEKVVTELRAQIVDYKRINISEELGAATAAVNAGDSTQAQLTGNVEGIDENSIAPPPVATTTTVRASTPAGTRSPGKLFLGANVAYAPVARAATSNDGMSGTTEFSTAFAGGLQVGYHVRPAISLGVATQIFNLRPKNEDAANEVELFVQATAHYQAAKRWELDVFGAPGYSAVLFPGGGSAKGLVLRYGGGLVYELNPRIGVTGELAHQLGFQRAKGNADLETSFVSLLFGVRIRP